MDKTLPFVFWVKFTKTFHVGLRLMGDLMSMCIQKIKLALSNANDTTINSHKTQFSSVSIS